MTVVWHEAQDDAITQIDARLTAIVDALQVEDRVIAAADARRVRLLAETARLADQKACLSAGGTGSDRVEWERRLAATEISRATRRGERSVMTLLQEAETLVDHLPSTLAALADGRVSLGHASHMVSHAITLPVDARGGFETVMLPVAEQLSPYRFGEKARQARELAHPDSITTRNKAAREERSVFIAPECDGMAMLTALLPAEEAIAIDDRLDKLARAHSLNDPARNDNSAPTSSPI